MSKFELAQLNIAKMRDSLESPMMSGFVENLDRINGLAEQSPGFRWRLQSEDGNATGFRPFGEDTLVNVSVWKDIESLRKFVFSADHVEIMRSKREWFNKMAEVYVVLWWVPAGHHPGTEEARDRLQHLRDNGPAVQAFTFKNSFSESDAAGIDH
jgi:hypothetical protein